MRRRRRRRATWTAGASAAAFSFGVLAWEAASGPAAPLRWVGYAGLGLGCTAVAAYAALRWLESAPSAGVVAERLERLFPQARGRVRDALGDGEAGLVGARESRARAWLARKGGRRLDAALAAGHGRAVARLRALTVGGVALALLVVVTDPGAARRAVSAVADPGTLWRAGGAWSVEPGDAVIPSGGSVAGRARFRGPEVDAALVLEWRTPDGSWRTDTLAGGPSARWRWESLAVGRRYRLRYGPYRSPEYAIEVGAPLALVELEARLVGGTWGPWSGFGARAGDVVEVRGRATEPIVAAGIRQGEDREIPFPIEGRTFVGAASVTAGPATVFVRTADGRVAESSSRTVARVGDAFVRLLRPEDDPVRLEASVQWLEIRAAAPDGVREVRWEREDGRDGRLAAAVGARDTVLRGIAPLGDGLAPGDTIRFRVVAVPVAGSPAVGSWRRAVTPLAEVLRERSRRERARAGRAADRAVAEARRMAGESVPGEAGAGTPPDEAEAADRGLRSAADSLASAIERTLADPDLPPEVRGRLAAYRSLLEDLESAELGERRPGSPSDPVAETSARADLLEELADRIAEAETLLERAEAARALDRVAAAERALAEETRRTEPSDLAASVGERQEALAKEAREALERTGEDAASGEPATEALERARGAIESGDPAAAAVAQEEAAGSLSAAASEARASMESGGEEAAARRAAVERAGSEALFLAERQREVASRLGRAPRDAAEHADRRARQQVVTRGLERTLGSLVEAIGGTPARDRLPELLARAVYETRRAERSVARPPRRPESGVRRAGGSPSGAATAAEDATDALAELARALLRPSGEAGGAGGAGAAGASGAVAEGLRQMAEAQTAVANAAGGTGSESDGGDPEAAAAQRDVAQGIGEVADEAEAAGLDRRPMDELARLAEEAAGRLERGLDGARAETELRSLSRRLSDLGRTIERDETKERRRSETAETFVPADPPPLTDRASAPALDPEAALAGWEGILPRPAVDAARRYLERLSEDGVREPTGTP